METNEEIVEMEAKILELTKQIALLWRQIEMLNDKHTPILKPIVAV